MIKLYTFVFLTEFYDAIILHLFYKDVMKFDFYCINNILVKIGNKRLLLYIRNLITKIIKKNNMKNLIKLFLGLLLSGIMLTGCEEVSDLADVKFSADYKAEIDVTVTPSSSSKAINGTFSAFEIIDPTSNSDYEKYLDKIKGVEITEFSAEVLSVDPNITLTSTTVRVFNNNYDATWEFTDLQIEAGTVITFDNDNGQWDSIEQILMEKEPFTVSINGQADEENAEFVLLFTFNSEVLASPFN